MEGSSLLYVTSLPRLVALGTLDSDRHCVNGYITILFCHVILQDCSIM